MSSKTSCIISDCNKLKKLFSQNMSKQCIFCTALCAGYSCSQCNQMNRGVKFSRLLQLLGNCSESIVYHDEITSVVQRIKQVSLLKLYNVNGNLMI